MADASAGSDAGPRVCIAVGKYPPLFGGHGIQIQRMLPFLRRHHVRPHVVTTRPPGRPAEGGEADVHRALTWGRGGLAKVARVLQFRHYLSRNARRYDVLHSGGLCGWEFLLNIAHAKRLGLAVVMEMVILGGDDPSSIKGEFLGGFKLGLVRQVDALVGIARAFRGPVIEAGIPADRFHLVYGGVDVGRYRRRSEEERRLLRASHGIDADARVVVSAGSIIRRKGIDRVVRAWARTSPVAGRDHLLLIGPHSPEENLPPSEMAYVEEIRRIIEDQGLGPTVRLLGAVTNLEEHMGLADVFLFLSRQEGLGYVTLEAMACGLPCVLSPMDGIAEELIEEGRSGHVVPDPDDADAVAAVVSGLLQDPELRNRYAGYARRVAVERFSLEARARSLAALYRDLVVRSGGRAAGA